MNEKFNDFLYNELFQIIKRYTNYENMKYDKDAKKIIEGYKKDKDNGIIYEKELEINSEIIIGIHKALMNKFKWREINNIEELKENFKNNDKLKILRIEDAIADTMFDLLNEEQGEVYTDEVLLKIYSDPKTSEKLKEFIMLYLKADTICKEIRKLI